MGAGLGQAGPRKGVLRKPRPRQVGLRKMSWDESCGMGAAWGWLGKRGWERCPGTVGFQAVTHSAVCTGICASPCCLRSLVFCQRLSRVSEFI
jgi:hypothetical protein